MNQKSETRRFIANEDVAVGQTIIDPTTGTDQPATATSVGPNSHDAEWFHLTVTGDRIGDR